MKIHIEQTEKLTDGFSSGFWMSYQWTMLLLSRQRESQLLEPGTSPAAVFFWLSGKRIQPVFPETRSISGKLPRIRHGKRRFVPSNFGPRRRRTRSIYFPVQGPVNAFTEQVIAVILGLTIQIQRINGQ